MTSVEFMDHKKIGIPVYEKMKEESSSRMSGVAARLI
jgi:hypothetical protein